MMSLARDLVRVLARSAEAPLPREVAKAACLHLLDAIGVGLASAGTQVGQPYRHFANETAHGGSASVFASRIGIDPASAALINGGLIHSLEYDDTHTASIAHGSAVLVPVALAVAESAGASGAALLGTYARGWELLIRIGRAAPGGFQQTGFQVTSAGGALVAAHIAAELRGLPEERRIAAIGIALSQASGVFEFLSNGATVKSLHPGWAAHGGVIAAALAHSGLTGPETAFEGRFGLFRVFARDPGASMRFADEIGTIGDVWHLTDAAFKFHPCCHYLHPFIEAAGILIRRGIVPDEIEHVTCRVSAGAAGVICEPWEHKVAATGHAARWSLPAVVAAQLVSGQVDLDTFEQPIPPQVATLASRVSWEPLAQDQFPQRFEAELSCRLRDDTVHEVRVDDVFGNCSRPATQSSVRDKFRSNARRSLTDSATATLEAAIDSLNEATNLGALSTALRGGQSDDGKMR
jgi:2-methylcitrate dehydratase PrpD